MGKQYFTDNEVHDVCSIEEFVDSYYKADRLNRPDEPGRRERIIADRQYDVSRGDVAIISRHDSVTGKLVCYREETV